MYFAFNMISAKNLVEQDREVGPGSTVLVASLPEDRVIGDVLGVHPMEEIQIANWCALLHMERNIREFGGCNWQK